MQQFADLQARRRLLLILLTQDVADALIALQDIAGAATVLRVIYSFSLSFVEESVYMRDLNMVFLPFPV
jgi:hypothetical protein